MFAFPLQNVHAYQNNEWIHDSRKIFSKIESEKRIPFEDILADPIVSGGDSDMSDILRELYFSLRVKPKKQIIYPSDWENSALNGSDKDLRLLATMWLSIKEAILVGRFGVPDEKIEEYCAKATQYAINWLKLGAKRGDGLCSYQLSLVYRFGEERDLDLSEKYAKKCVKALSFRLPSLSSEEYLALVDCYGNGWGIRKSYKTAKKLYETYVQQCHKENSKPLDWCRLGFNFLETTENTKDNTL